MPPKKPRLADERRRFETWVDAGAPVPAAARQRRSVAPDLATPASTGRSSRSGRPDPPAVNDAAWVRNPIDAFILAKLEERGWQPAPDASRANGSAASPST